MILLACIPLGLLLRMAAGRPVAWLAHSRLRGEGFLLVSLAMQIAAPSLHLTGVASHVGYWVWLATFPCMALIAWSNRSEPGIAVLGAGLVMNFAVIFANTGMPVYPAAAAAIRSGSAALAIPTGDFVHVAATASTRLPWLADVIPVPGPSWLRALASPGDIMLFVGVVVFVAMAGAGRRDATSVPQFAGIRRTVAKH